MSVIFLIVEVWVSLIIFYTLYLAAINVYGHRNEMNPWVLVICSPILIAMLLVDMLMQRTVFALVFWDRGQEWLVTQRLQRYRALPFDNWRTRWATLICTRLLNPFDPSRHHC